MNLSHRTLLSLTQFLDLFRKDLLVVLLEKHRLEISGLEYAYPAEDTTSAIRHAVLQASSELTESLLGEVVRTSDSMRYETSPKYRFDERWKDLLLCLQLDGYTVAVDENGDGSKTLIPIEPTIEGVSTVEDDLTAELRRSGLSSVDGIVLVIQKSAEAFRHDDFNGCLNNVRVALQSTATAIAERWSITPQKPYNSEKWGEVLAYLRASNFITKQQEEGLAGVFRFASPGSHIPLGFTEQEFARLGRSLVLGFCYFLVKHHNAKET